MNEVYWIDEGRVAGRCGPWRVPFDLEAMARGGIGHILSLDAHEASLLPEATGRIGRTLIHLTDSIPPEAEDRAIYSRRVPRAVAHLSRIVQAGSGAILVHCHAGNDRTGTVLASWLHRTRGLAPEEAIAAVRRANPEALSAFGYEAMALEIMNSAEWS